MITILARLKNKFDKMKTKKLIKEKSDLLNLKYILIIYCAIIDFMN